MSDRRAVSAGQLAVSSVAANEPWRVAVGGNRVQNMSVEQIAQAFAAGQLTVRTPLWPPGTSGWQALGNFEQFTQSGTFAQPGYGQLSQFEEADDDPTRMWTGSGDLSELAGMGMEPLPMDPVPPMPSVPPPLESRPSARTGPRQVSARPPTARSMPAPPVARPPSMPPAAIARAMRPRRSSGLWLVAGLVGLVGLGSAVLAARGTSSVAAPSETVASATPSPEPSQAVAPKAEAPKAEEPKLADPATGSAEATAKADAPSEVNQARLAKYEDSTASAFVAEGQPAKDLAAKDKAASETKPSSEKADVSDAVASKPAREKSSRLSSASKHASAAASAPKAKAAAHAAVEPKEIKEPVAKEPIAKEPKPAKEAKAEAPASSAVNEAAATALGNSAKLASSCRPRGGPSGEGKARVIYSNDGEVQSVEILTAKFRDTLTASCVKMVFRRAKIAPFKGEPPTFIKSFTIPEE